MDIIETVLMFLYKLSKTKLMTKGAKLASAASADALPVFKPRRFKHSKELPGIP